jgi:FKBP-type peptidyl-prolyl cis-trans isomerase
MGVTRNRVLWSGLAIAAVIVSVAVARRAWAADDPTPAAKAPEAGMPKTDVKPVTTASGLQYIDFKVGDGPSPKKGEIAIVHYTGWLDDGKKFDSSHDRGKPFGFKVGMGQVIKGWDEGVATMKVGGIRRLIIPPELAYGAKGAGKVVPPNARLTFDVELLDVRP